MLEINTHDGPARLGKYEDQKTPCMLKPEDLTPRIPDEPMPYNVPRALAEFSVKKTIENAMKSEETGVAVIHGSKYVDLRLKCALELEKLENNLLVVANSEELINRPMDLIKIVTELRQALNPGTALYFPFVKINFIPLLVYMGVDFFGVESGDFYAQLEMITTPHKIYELKDYQICQFNREELRDYNRNTLQFVLSEVKENIKNGTLRNLVEERCCSSPETMTALRILDGDYSKYLDKYTPIY